MRRAFNREPPPGDRLLARQLTRTAAIDQLLTSGLDIFLRESGATPAFRDAVAEFVGPALVLLAEVEADVIRSVRGPGKEELPLAREIDEPGMER